MAAAAFLARYSGRTLDAYRYDLRCFFQWASDADLAVLEAKRPNIELYRTSIEQRNLAPTGPAAGGVGLGGQPRKWPSRAGKRCWTAPLLVGMQFDTAPTTRWTPQGDYRLSIVGAIPPDTRTRLHAVAGGSG